MKPVVVFHVAAMNHWREIVQEIVAGLENSGLGSVAPLIANIVGDAEEPPTVLNPWIVSHWGALSDYEYPTLALLSWMARDEPGRAFLYLHTKGASRPRARIQRASWRRFMSHFLILQWRRCLGMIESGMDTVGVQIVRDRFGREPHYCGNWWWARGSYLSTLGDPGPRFTRRHPRMGAEAWLMSGRGRHHSLYQYPGRPNMETWPFPETYREEKPDGPR